jgi:hypothetical protein
MPVDGEGFAAQVMRMANTAPGLPPDVEAAYTQHVTRNQSGMMMGFPGAGDAFAALFQAQASGPVTKQPGAAPAPTAPAAAPDLAAQLQSLASLRASGALTEKEFVAAKRRLIDSSVGGAAAAAPGPPPGPPPSYNYENRGSDWPPPPPPE